MAASVELKSLHPSHTPVPMQTPPQPRADSLSQRARNAWQQFTEYWECSLPWTRDPNSQACCPECRTRFDECRSVAILCGTTCCCCGSCGLIVQQYCCMPPASDPRPCLENRCGPQCAEDWYQFCNSSSATATVVTPATGGGTVCACGCCEKPSLAVYNCCSGTQHEENEPQQRLVPPSMTRTGENASTSVSIQTDRKEEPK